MKDIIPLLFIIELQEYSGVLISGGIFIEHLGDHIQKGVRQGAAAHRADLNTSHAVDAQIIVGQAGVIRRNGTHGTLPGTGTALNTVFVCCRMECSGFQFLVGDISGNLHRWSIV